MQIVSIRLGEPQSGKLCAAISLTSGKWQASNCDLMSPFVCEIYALGDTSSCPTKPTCPSGWTYYEGSKKCFKVGLLAASEVSR